VASGKAAARSVYRHVTGRQLAAEAITVHLTLERYQREPGYEAIRRAPVPTTEPVERLRRPDMVVECGYSPAEAQREASRCLDCGVTPVFDGSRCVLCGGCIDVCPTQCLKLASLAEIEPGADLDALVDTFLGADAVRAEHSAILKDEDRCIRCALCAMRCPADAISMERVACSTQWRTL
jgi:ferredoxin